MMSINSQTPLDLKHSPRPTRLHRPVEVRAFDLDERDEFEAHAHEWHQFTYSAKGALTVMTEEGWFVAPPAMAVWIPSGIRHSIRTFGPAQFRSVYVGADAISNMPAHCTVLDVDPLLRYLILEAAGYPRDWDERGSDGRLMAVLLDRIAAASAAPLALPLPRDKRLQVIVTALMDDPGDGRGLKDFAKLSGASERTLARLFKSETGLTFGRWRQQARLMAAVERLSQGQSVTSTALDLGYESPSAFIAMFRQQLGTTPSNYAAGT